METVDIEKSLKELEGRLNKKFTLLRKVVTKLKADFKEITDYEGYIKFRERQGLLKEYERDLDEVFNYSVSNQKLPIFRKIDKKD